MSRERNAGLSGPQGSWTHEHLYPVNTIQPVVTPVGQPVGCLFTRCSPLSLRFDNRFDKRQNARIMIRLK